MPRRSSSFSIIVPAFFHPPSPSKAQHEPADAPRASASSLRPPPIVVRDPSPPPDYLLGDDPFANLTPVESVHASAPTSPRARSLRSPPTSPTWHNSPSPSAPHSPLGPPPPFVLSGPLSPRKRVRPATTRPAFRPRPSLPSLRDLSLAHFHVPPTNSKLGSRFPLEPWDEPLASVHDHVDASGPSRRPASFRSVSVPAATNTPPTSPPAVDDAITSVTVDGDPPEWPGRVAQPKPLSLVLEAPEDGGSIHEPIIVVSEPAQDPAEFEPWVTNVYGSDGSFRLSRSLSSASTSSTSSSVSSGCSSSATSAASSDYFGLTADTTPIITEPSTPDSFTRVRTATLTLAVHAATAATDQRSQIALATTASHDLFAAAGSSTHHQVRRARSAPHLHRPPPAPIDDPDWEAERPMSYPVYASAPASRHPYPSSHYHAAMAAHPTHLPRPADTSDSSEDDVPLAAAIPGALKAQRTIRRQVREERAARKASVRRPPTVPTAAATAHAAVPMPATAPGAADLKRSKTVLQPGEAPRLRPHVAERLAAQQAQAPVPPASIAAFNDAMHKMQNVQIAESASAGPARRARSNTVGDRSRPAPTAPAAPMPEPAQTIRPMRSFHAPSAAAGLGRSGTTSRKRTEEPGRPSGGSGLERARSVKTAGPSTSGSPAGRVSGEGDRRVSNERARTATAPAGTSVPSVPALPTVKLTRHRVYVGDNEGYHTIELAPGATASAVLTQLDERNAFDTWKGSGGWMLFEVAKDYGMERPLRTFERVDDVVGSWSRDRTANSLVARLTPYAGVLSRQNVPEAAPIYGGWVEYEAKRGKWTKRWLSVHDHALYLGKREGGRGAELLCLLSNFDAYVVTAAAKAPRAAVFAVKSTESLAFFEDATEYLHLFSVDERAAETWMHKIWLARSFALLQERTTKAAAAPAPAATGAGLSRAGTTRRPAPAQPLMSVPHTAPTPPTNYGFEPGTLLGRRP